MTTLDMNFDEITSGPNNTIDLPLPDNNSGENVYFRTFVDGLAPSAFLRGSTADGTRAYPPARRAQRYARRS